MNCDCSVVYKQWHLNVVVVLNSRMTLCVWFVSARHSSVVCR